MGMYMMKKQESDPKYGSDRTKMWQNILWSGETRIEIKIDFL